MTVKSVAIASTPACHFQPKAVTVAGLIGLEPVDGVRDLRDLRAVTASPYIKQATFINSEGCSQGELWSAATCRSFSSAVVESDDKSPHSIGYTQLIIAIVYGLAMTNGDASASRR